MGKFRVNVILLLARDESFLSGNNRTGLRQIDLVAECRRRKSADLCRNKNTEMFKCTDRILGLIPTIRK